MKTSSITVTDMFCGAGGSTTGATMAGAEVKLALNHWKRAIETHNTNYPQTTHAVVDLHQEDPRRFKPTTVLIASPECTSQTLAKGKKRTGQGQMELWETGPDLVAEAEEKSRCTMWTPLMWAEYHDYQAIILENVVDVHLWRPFQAWLQAWKSLDYDYEIVYLNSMHAHPTPQSRDRMYFVAWKNGNQKPDLKITPLAHCSLCQKDINAVQCWKNPGKRHGKYKQQYVYCCPVCAHETTPYYYAAMNAVDWSLPAPRIGDRKNPLQAKTLDRIQYGLDKFAQHAFIMDHLGEYRPRSINAALSTICAGGNHQSLIVPPYLINLNHPEPRPIDAMSQVFPTQTAYDATGLVVPPSHSWLMSYYNNGAVLPTTSALPTVTTLDRVALLSSEAYPVTAQDCGFRMLAPKEIQSAMAFPQEYVVTGTRREQVKQLGNAVTPPVMHLLMTRVMASLANSVA